MGTASKPLITFAFSVSSVSFNFALRLHSSSIFIVSTYKNTYINGYILSKSCRSKWIHELVASVLSDHFNASSKYFWTNFILLFPVFWRIICLAHGLIDKLMNMFLLKQTFNLFVVSTYPMATRNSPVIYLLLMLPFHSMHSSPSL